MPSKNVAQVELEVSGAVETLGKQAAIENEALSELQDLYCTMRLMLDPKRDELKVLEAEFKPVEEALMSAIDEIYDPKEPLTHKTALFMLSAGAKGKSLTVTDKKLLIEMIGLDTFLELAEMSVTDMRKYLTPPQLAQVAEEVYKTKRKVTFAKV